MMRQLLLLQRLRYVGAKAHAAPAWRQQQHRALAAAAAATTTPAPAASAPAAAAATAAQGNGNGNGGRTRAVVDFEDTATAYSALETSDLVRAYLVFKLCGFRPLGG